MDDDRYVDLFVEICDGFSSIEWGKVKLFLKHLSVRDQGVFSAILEKNKEIAIEKGLEEESVILSRLKADGDWTDEDDLKLSEKESYLSALKKTKAKLMLPSLREQTQATIDDESKELSILRSRRNELVGKTAEDFAYSRSNEEFLRLLLFKDKEFSQLAFSPQEFGELEVEDLSFLVAEYHKLMNRCNDASVQECVLQDFFSMYMGFCEKPYDFFGCPVVQFSVFQIKLLVYAKMFQNIFQNTEKIPESIRKDPKALLDFSNSDKTKEKFKPRGKTEGGNTAVFGTKEDASRFDSSAKVVDLASELKKNGGKMDLNQMAKAMGHDL